MAYDDILTILGEFGPYQRGACLWLALFNIYSAIPLLFTLFLFVDIPFRCSVPGLENDTFHIQDNSHQLLVNASIPYDVNTGLYSQCSRYLRANIGDEGDNDTVTCDRWVFDSDYASTSLFSYLDIVCDRKYIKTHFRMIFALGLAFSAMCAGPAGDTFGRKRPMITLILVSSPLYLVFLLTKSIPVLLIVCCAVSFCVSSAYLYSFTLAIEIIGPSKRPLAGLSILLGWSVGLLLAALMYYLIDDWRIETYTMSGMGFCFVYYFWAIQESPRWLLTQNKMEDAQKIFRVMAKANKIELPKNVELTSMVTSKEEREKKTTRFPLKDLKSIFTNRVLITRVIVLSTCWFASNLIYVGLTYNTGELLEGDLYINFITQALMEILSYVLAYVLTGFFPRRLLLCGFVLTSGLSFMLNAISIILDIGANWIRVLCYGIAKLGNTGGYTLMFVTANEILPTVVRNTAVGICMFIGQIGGLVSPYVVILDTLVPSALGKSLPLFVCGISSIIGGLLALLLPETKGQKLPDTIEDAKKLGKSLGKTSSKAATEVRVESILEDISETCGEEKNTVC